MYTTLKQGNFVSNGADRIIPIPTDADFIQIVNYTKAASNTNNATFRWNWYKGMADNAALHESKVAGNYAISATGTAGTAVVNANGITVFNSSTQLPGTPRAITGVTNDVAPVVATANTAGLFANTVIRIFNNTANPTLSGLDYSATALVANTSFTLPTHATALPGGGTGTWRIISFSSIPEFYPVERTVINVSQAQQAVVTTSVIHYYKVGMKVRFVVPAECGMTELDGKEATIVTVETGGDTHKFTIDLNTTGYTAFTWPLLADFPARYASVTPSGQESTTRGAAPGYGNLYGDSVENKAYYGFLLGSGDAYSPAGQDGDVMYWTAFKSFNL